MDGFLHQFFAGVASGSIYAILGLAAVMVFLSTRHLNFAQGEMATFSTCIAWALISAGIPYWVAFILTIAISFILGTTIERLIISRVRNAPALVSILLFIEIGRAHV